MFWACRIQDPLQQGRSEEHLGNPVFRYELGKRARQEHHIIGNNVYRSSLQQRTVRTAVSLDLADLAVQAVDGIKVPANAAWHRSYPEKQLRQLLERVEKAIADLEAQNEGGQDGASARLPEKLPDQKTLRQRVRQAMEELPERERPNRYKRPFRINLTDRDARSMRTGPGVVLGYNARPWSLP